MIKVYSDEGTEQVVLHFDDETLQGQYSIIKMEDHAAMELMAQLCVYYDKKGLDTIRLLIETRAAFAPRRTWLQRLLGRI